MIAKTPESLPKSGTPEVDRRRVLLTRVIGSSIFVKSERLSAFLSTICELTLAGRSAEINEHTIGTSVFGRSPHYDSSIDGIVRTQASRLRQKLDLYFLGEGLEEPIRIVLPRGSYVPVFEERVAPSVPEEPPSFPAIPVRPPLFPVDPGAAKTKTAFRSRWLVLTLLPIALLAGLLTHLTEKKQHPLWSHLFTSDHPTLVVPGDSGLVMREGILNRSLGLGSYLNPDRDADIPATVRLQADDFGQRRYTSIVDLEIAQSLAEIAGGQKKKLQIRFARDLRPEELRRDNVVLIGATEANPWVELFERNMNFVFFTDRTDRTMSVLNRSPHKGEPKQWDSSPTDAQKRVYAVVAFVPNLSGSGDALILEGTSMAGTDSAWEFVSDDAQLMPFLQRIQRKDGSIPHFEIVLGTNNLSGSAAKNTVLAWRVDS